MSDDSEGLEGLRAAKAARLDSARPEAVSRVHGGGKLTARERIEALVDPGSAVEYGTIAARDPGAGWVAETGGVDVVATVEGRPVVASSTDYTDRGGGYGASRLERLMGLAYEHRWPMVLFVDGGGTRARHPRAGLGHIEISAAMGRFQLFDGMAELSGRVPTVAIVSGPAFAGHASLAGFSDCVIATPGSSIGMGGPPMVEAAFGITLTPNELAGVEMHQAGGGIDLLVADEQAAVAAARRYLSYQTDRDGGTAAPDALDIAALVPPEGDYDMHPVLEALVDEASLLELRGGFARSVITAFARIGGRSVGVIASQPAIDSGRIDEHAAIKTARFVELCDAYEFPLVALVDSEGCVTRWPGSDGEVLEPGVSRWHSRALIAHHHRSVPSLVVQVRRAHGLSLSILGGSPNGRTIPALQLAWPGTELGHVDGFTSLRNPNAFDDVIEPAQTRERMLRILTYLRGRPGRPAGGGPKKHPIDSW